MDPRTVFIMAVFVVAFIALAMVAVASGRKAYPGFRFWTGFFASTAVGLALVAARGVLPDSLSVLLGNLLILLALALFNEGVHRFFPARPQSPLPADAVAIISAMALIAYFTYPSSDITSRIIVFSLCCALLCLHALALLYSSEGSKKSLGRIMLSAGFSLYGSLALFRASKTIFLPVESLFKEGPVQIANLTLSIGTMLFLLIGCLLLVEERALAENRETNRHFDTLIGNLPGVVFRVGAGEDATIEFLSDGMSLLSSHKPDKFVGKPVSELRQVIDPEDWERYLAEIASAVAGGGSYNLTYRIRDADGLRRWLFEHGTVVSDDQGRFTSRDGFISDITEDVEASAQREKLLAELIEATDNVRTLSGLIPLCAACKKIRDDKGYWQKLEEYLNAHTGADFVTGLCPACEGNPDV